MKGITFEQIANILLMGAYDYQAMGIIPSAYPFFSPEDNIRRYFGHFAYKTEDVELDRDARYLYIYGEMLHGYDHACVVDAGSGEFVYLYLINE